MTVPGGRAARQRRSSAALAVALVALLLVAGCTGGDSTPVEARGSTAEVPDAAAAGYEHVETTTRSLNATLTVTLQGDVEGRESQDVVATIPVARYSRETDAGPSVFAVAASPSVEVVENPPESADPLSTRSTAELAAFVQPTYGEPADLEATGTRQVELLGAETELTTFHGTATRDGEDVDVVVHVARVADGGDVVTAVAVHPAGVDERGRIAELLGSVSH